MKRYSAKDALIRHPEVNRPRVGVKDMLSRFPGTAPGSVRSTLIDMGPFIPKRDGFHFENDFAITAEQAVDFLDAFSRAVLNEAVELGLGRYKRILNAFSIPIPVAPDIPLPAFLVNTVLDRVLTELTARLIDLAADPVGQGDFGRCGGMAFAGYDFYRRDWRVDLFGTVAPTEGELGEYIYGRLLDSLVLNARTFLEWEMVLKVLPVVSTIATATLLAAAAAIAFPIGPAIVTLIGSRVDVFNVGGPSELRDRSKEQWDAVKGKLDVEAAWPLGLIYGNRHGAFKQHQVLAIGYADGAVGRGTLTVWDNNDGAKWRKLRVDFRGDELEVVQQAEPPNPVGTKEVKGFFLERYSPRRPPSSLRMP